jgi:yecA family protein
LSAPLYERVARALAALRCDVGAAECHGMLCGMLSGPRPFAAALWLDHVSGGVRTIFDSGEPHAALTALMDATITALADDDYDFVLVLPSDEAPLLERAAGFAAWCRGFLSGLGLSGIADLELLGEDAREFLADLSRFATLGLDADGDEDDERALVELTEFTRMGVMLVRAELKHGGDDDEPASWH